MSQCDYILTGLRRCPKHATHVQVSVKSVCGEGTVTYFRRVCTEHSKADDKDIHTWTSERMEAARKAVQS